MAESVPKAQRATKSTELTDDGIQPLENRLEIAGLVIIGIVVILIIGITDSTAKNAMGFLVHRGLKPLIGNIGIVLLPLGLVFLSFSCLKHRNNQLWNAIAQYFLFACFLSLPVIWLNVRIVLNKFHHPSDNDAVGMLGASIGSVFESLFGQVGGIVVLVVIGLISLPPVSGYAPSQIVKGLANLKNMLTPEIEDEPVKKKRRKRNKPNKENDVEDDIEGLLDEMGYSESGTAIEEIEAGITKAIADQDGNGQVEETTQMQFNFKKMLREIGEYKFPSTDLLLKSKNGVAEADKQALATRIEKALANFGVEAKVEDMIVGPVIIRCELRPAPGVSVRKIKSLQDDLKLALAAKTLRIEAPISGRDVIGIEFPTIQKKIVTLREVLETKAFTESKSLLTMCIGKDLAGKPIVKDLGKMPHLLIAGQTGAGKSVCLNAIVMSLLYNTAPDEVKMILIDPKRVELTLYDGMPHLMAPVLDDWQLAKNALMWTAREMTGRLDKFKKARCREISAFNKKRPNGEFMPYIIIVIDEFATLMDLAPNGKDVMRLINHLARLARATGIHLIIATQRPEVKVITGSIKANIPARIAFSVASHVDSKTILDKVGAEQLLGEGDMLYAGPSDKSPIRAQGAFVSDEEIEKVVDFLMAQMEPEYKQEMLVEQGEIDDLDGITPDDDPIPGFEDEGEDEEYFQIAMKLLFAKKRISASLIQRECRIGYNRASRIIDRMEELGIITGMDGQRARRLVENNDFMDNILNP